MAPGKVTGLVRAGSSAANNDPHTAAALLHALASREGGTGGRRRDAGIVL